MLLPVAAATALAVVVTATHRRLPPRLATQMVTTALVVLVAAAVPTLWIVSLGFLTHLPLLGGRLAWCATVFGVHVPVSPWIGIPTLAITSTGIVRARGVLRSYRHLRQDHPGSLEITEDHRPFAYTLPGRGGRVVASSALVDLLDSDERRVVLAHERAHATHRHDRYLLTAQLATAMVPPVGPLAARLRFSLERWADEAAVGEAGDRRFVAETLGKVALHRFGLAGAAGFAGLGVPARVAALLSPPMPAPGSSARIVLWGGIAVTATLGLFQLHHAAGLIGALCFDR